MSKDSERERAKEMNEKGYRDGQRGVKTNTPSDRTYGDYVRDAQNYREGREAGESKRKK